MDVRSAGSDRINNETRQKPLQTITLRTVWLVIVRYSYALTRRNRQINIANRCALSGVSTYCTFLRPECSIPVCLSVCLLQLPSDASIHSALRLFSFLLFILIYFFFLLLTQFNSLLSKSFSALCRPPSPPHSKIQSFIDRPPTELSSSVFFPLSCCCYCCCYSQRTVQQYRLNRQKGNAIENTCKELNALPLLTSAGSLLPRAPDRMCVSVRMPKNQCCTICIQYSAVEVKDKKKTRTSKRKEKHRVKEKSIESICPLSESGYT